MTEELYVTPVFKVIKAILFYREYKDREQVLTVASTMVKLAQDNDEFTDEMTKIYIEAFEKLAQLSFEQMQSLKESLKSAPTNENK